MRITDLLDKNSINLNASPQNKKEALDQAVELMARSGKINDIEAYRKQVYAREEERRGEYHRCRRRNCHSSREMQCCQCTWSFCHGNKRWS